ncbi:MAG: HPr(Ser) kinase/phosphatase [Ruminococcaceae bacterium]|nr:HPr(Ser) kinase/phosphatase [Oscillospiraceae bacterium]
MTKQTVALKTLISDFKLETVYLPERNIVVSNANVNRPGLPLTGFFEHFEPSRIQIIGKSEYYYLAELPEELRTKRLRDFMAKEPIAIIYSTNLEPGEEVAEMAREYDIPLLITPVATSEFMAGLISKLSVYLAPCITRHGVLVEVYGEGVLILGDSGIGKSETAIELVKRGHRLIADDAVELRRVSDRTITGTAPEIIRHYVELRGIGVIDVKRIFGVGAVKDVEKIDLVINLENWVQGKMYDRMGLEDEYTDIMGLKIVSNTIPVHPGRNLAVIIEIAAINNRQKRMGFNTAREFNNKLLENIGM